MLIIFRDLLLLNLTPWGIAGTAQQQHRHEKTTPRRATAAQSESEEERRPTGRKAPSKVISCVPQEFGVALCDIWRVRQAQ